MCELLRYSFWWNTARCQNIHSGVRACYEINNLFIKPQNFLLMFFICKLKGLHLIVTVFDGLLILSLDLFSSCIKPTWSYVFQDVLLKCFTPVFLTVYSDTSFLWGSILWILSQPGGRPEILCLLLITWRSMLWYELSQKSSYMCPLKPTLIPAVYKQIHCCH